MLPTRDRCAVPAGDRPLDKDRVLVLWPPGTGDRANYTIHRSANDGLTWDYVGVIYPKGAGYSDIHVLPHDGPGDRLGVAFQRTLYDPKL